MKYLIFIAFLFTANLFSATITIAETEREYSLKYSDEASYRLLRFNRGVEDSLFSYFNFSRSGKSLTFVNEMAVLDTLFGIAAKKIEIGLKSASVGYPLEYPDIMPDYIQAFLDSEEWQTHATVEGKELNYAVMHDIIRGSTIFSGLVDLMYLHGYYISGISSEKHGFVTKDDLIRYGFKGDEIIPMPFMLYWKVERVKKIK
jgi:hypothetical protein